MAKSSKSTVAAQERLVEATQRLRALHASGLFTDLEASEIEATVPRFYRTRDVLVAAVYRHTKKHPPVYALRSRPYGDVTADVPPGLGLERVMVRATRRHVRLSSGLHAGLFEPTDPFDWARLVDVALGELGDARRVVPLASLDEDDVMFVIATGEQTRVLTETRLANTQFEPKFRHWPLPRVELEALLRTTADALAARLPAAVASVRAGGVELDLSPDAARDLSDTLYIARYRATTQAARAARSRA